MTKREEAKIRRGLATDLKGSKRSERFACPPDEYQITPAPRFAAKPEDLIICGRAQGGRERAGVTAPLISRCRVCGFLRDGDLCGRCAAKGFVIVNDELIHPDGTRVEEDYQMSEYGPRRDRVRRAPHNDEDNAERRTA